jgi:hypothetical protein
MNAHWSDRYLGLPYDEQAFDCAALAERVRREVFGQDLHLPSERRPGPFGRSAQISQNIADCAVQTFTPADGDGVLLVCNGRLQHIGMYCVIAGEPWVVHNQAGQGVTRRRVRELAKWGYRIEGYYQWI